MQPHWGIRTERYKWIDYPLTGLRELFDLELDPTEMLNRATDPELKPTAEGLQRQLPLIRKQYGDNEQPTRTRPRVRAGARGRQWRGCVRTRVQKKRPALVQRLGVCEKPRRRPTFSQSNIIGDFRLTTVFGMGTGMARSP